jgi:hypothetical protein
MAYNIKSLQINQYGISLTAKDDYVIYDGSATTYSAVYLPENPVIGQTHTILIKGMASSNSALNFFSYPKLMRVTPNYTTSTLSITNDSLNGWTFTFTFDGTDWLTSRTHPVPTALAVLTTTADTPISIRPWIDLIVIATSPIVMNMDHTPFIGEQYKFFVPSGLAYNATLNIASGIKVGTGTFDVLTAYDLFNTEYMTTITFVGPYWISEQSPRLYYAP